MNFRYFSRFILLFFIFLTGCAGVSTSSPFTQTNIDKLRAGMTTTEVRQIFGPPNESRNFSLGTGKSCEILIYRHERLMIADFNFCTSDISTIPVLDRWNVRRVN
jgi:hypothetical protein